MSGTGAVEGLRGWQRKVFGQLGAGGRCAAQGLLGPGHLSLGQLETRLQDKGDELLKAGPALTTNMLQETTGWGS